MEPGQTLPSRIRTQRRKIVRMGKSLNLKRSRKTSRNIRRKRWKRWKNRDKRVHHPNARFLERRSPSISNDLWTVVSQWWNVLTVRERVRSLRLRVSLGSHRTSHAKSRPKFRASVGLPQEKRIRTWLAGNDD